MDSVHDLGGGGGLRADPHPRPDEPFSHGAWKGPGFRVFRVSDGVLAALNIDANRPRSRNCRRRNNLSMSLLTRNGPQGS